MQLYALEDYVAQSRVLLQDTVMPYRYDDESLVTSLNLFFYEVSRVRPDILIDGKYQTRNPRRQNLNSYGMPVFTVGQMDDTVPVPPPYKMSFIHFMVGFAQLRDTEDAQDSRAAAFMAKAIAQLTTLAA